MRLFILEHAQNAYYSLKSTKVRTMLTTLGVAIGVASITAILSLGSGLTQVVSRQVQALGGNIAIVRPGVPSDDEQSIANPTLEQNYSLSTLSEQDFTDIEDINGVDSVAPIMITS